jgi:hypothetical protein
MCKLAIATASVMLAVALSVSSVVPTAYAASKVDCDAVMQEIGQGKTMRQVASDMSISVGSVRRCRRHARAAAKAEQKTSPGNRERMTRSEASRAAGRPAGVSPQTSPEASPEAAPEASPATSR